MLHHKVVLLAWKHRTHVVCDKPLAVNCVAKASVLAGAVDMGREGQKECRTPCKTAVLLKLRQHWKAWRCKLATVPGHSERPSRLGQSSAAGSAGTSSDVRSRPAYLLWLAL